MLAGILFLLDAALSDEAQIAAGTKIYKNVLSAPCPHAPDADENRRGRRDWIQRAAYPDHPYSAVVKKTSVYGLIWNEDGLKNFLNSIINLKPYSD